MSASPEAFSYPSATIASGMPSIHAVIHQTVDLKASVGLARFMTKGLLGRTDSEAPT